MFRLLELRSASLAAALCLAAAPALTADQQNFQPRGKPVVQRGDMGAWSASFIDAAAVVHHDGKYHMFFDALPKWPHPLAIGYATSDDGHNWVKGAEGPVLRAEDTGLEVASIMGNSALVTEDGKWVLYFTLVHPEKHFHGAIGRATAAAPTGPWTVHPGPVLEPGPAGAWDGLHVGAGNVVKAGDGYRMYYTGLGRFQNGAFSEEHENVGMATSPDGINWKKHDDPTTTDAYFGESDPVLAIAEDENAWDSWAITDTNVQRTAGGWAMVYRGTSFSGSGALGLATSTDGVTWNRVSEKPFLTNRDLGVGKLYFAAYLHHEGRDRVYVEGGSTNGTQIFLAERAYLY